MKLNKIKYSVGHIMEMSWSFATEWIKGVHLFEYRLLNNLPEDNDFEYKLFREDVDFICFLIACSRLERAILTGCRVWGDSAKKKELKMVLERFKKATPYIDPLRNTSEHLDDYLFQKGKDASINSSGLRSYSVGYEKGKTYEINWLNYKIDLKEAAKEADILYKDFLAIYKEAIDSLKAERLKA